MHSNKTYIWNYIYTLYGILYIIYELDILWNIYGIIYILWSIYIAYICIRNFKEYFSQAIFPWPIILMTSIFIHSFDNISKSLCYIMKKLSMDSKKILFSKINLSFNSMFHEILGIDFLGGAEFRLNLRAVRALP